MPAQLNGSPGVSVGGKTDHHMEAVLAAPRLETLDALLPVIDPQKGCGLLRV